MRALTTILILWFIIWGLTGCGSDPQTNTTLKTTPHFQAADFGLQTIQADTLTRVKASYVSIGDYIQYNRLTSTWTPNVKGDYYIDSQVIIRGTYTNPTVTAYVVIMYEGQPYLTENTTFTVPTGVSVDLRVMTNAVIPFDGVSDSVYASVYVSQDTQVVSEQSQFEGYYVGDKVGTP